MSDQSLTWWNSLRHGGLLITPARLGEFFPKTCPPLPIHLDEQLRRDLTRLDIKDANSRSRLLQTLMVDICGLAAGGEAVWLKGNRVPAEFSARLLTGESLRPDWLWQGALGTALPLFVDREKRLGIGRGRRSYARVVEWLRQSDCQLALLTNMEQWRLIYTGLDNAAWC